MLKPAAFPHWLPGIKVVTGQVVILQVPSDQLHTLIVAVHVQIPLCRLSSKLRRSPILVHTLRLIKKLPKRRGYTFVSLYLQCLTAPICSDSFFLNMHEYTPNGCDNQACLVTNSMISSMFLKCFHITILTEMPPRFRSARFGIPMGNEPPHTFKTSFTKVYLCALCGHFCAKLVFGFHILVRLRY